LPKYNTGIINGFFDDKPGGKKQTYFSVNFRFLLISRISRMVLDRLQLKFMLL